MSGNYAVAVAVIDLAHAEEIGWIKVGDHPRAFAPAPWHRFVELAWG